MQKKNSCTTTTVLYTRNTDTWVRKTKVLRFPMSRIIETTRKHASMKMTMVMGKKNFDFICFQVWKSKNILEIEKRGLGFVVKYTKEKRQESYSFNVITTYVLTHWFKHYNHEQTLITPQNSKTCSNEKMRFKKWHLYANSTKLYSVYGILNTADN